VFSLKKLFGQPAPEELSEEVAKAGYFTPEQTRIYAIGDIHGHIDLLKDLAQKIADDLTARPVQNAQFVFLGDYIDRGPASNEVLSYLNTLMRRGGAVFLRGNHEEMLMRFLSDVNIMEEWRRFGGLETLDSYAVPTHRVKQGFGYAEAQEDLKNHMPQTHLEFLEATLPFYECGDYFFCHAGIDPQRPLDRQNTRDLLWIRQEFLNSERQFMKKIVHGHTPVREIDNRKNRINVDTGAYRSGILSCVVLEGATAGVLDTQSPAP
jgi:serine/threonine protein phosphatase 1